MTEATSGHYAEGLWSNSSIEQIIRNARVALHKVDYECFVGRGLSGSLMAAHLAFALNKELLIVRKVNESSHGMPLEGYAKATKCVVVDDFISVGATMDTIMTALGTRKILLILLYVHEMTSSKHKDIPIANIYPKVITEDTTTQYPSIFLSSRLL
jgi:orotate phosphoribosyltransferase-like protein